MKSILLAVIVAVSALSTSIVALPAHSFTFAENFCQYIATDDEIHMLRLLKVNKIRIRNIFHDLSCNNQNMLEFAASKNALKTGNLIIQKTRKSIVFSNIILLNEKPELLEAANIRLSN